MFISCARETHINTFLQNAVLHWFYSAVHPQQQISHSAFFLEVFLFTGGPKLRIVSFGLAFGSSRVGVLQHSFSHEAFQSTFVLSCQ